MKTETIIKDCNWYGWCREFCNCHKLQTTITYDDYGLPISSITESIPINKDFCMYLECINYKNPT